MVEEKSLNFFIKPDHKNGLICLHPDLCRINKKGAMQLPVCFKNRMLLDSVTPNKELAALKHLGLKGRGP
jgi:hypothetical protein